MIENYDRFSELLTDCGANWRALAEAFREEGLLDRRGRAASAKCARQTWLRVRNARQRRPEKRAVGGSPSTAECRVSVIAQPAPRRTEERQPDDEMKRVREALTRGEEWLPTGRSKGVAGQR